VTQQEGFRPNIIVGAKKEIGDEQFLMFQLGKAHVICKITLEHLVTSCHQSTPKESLKSHEACFMGLQKEQEGGFDAFLLLSLPYVHQRSASMRIYHYSYPVKLSEEQRRFLETMVHMSSTPAKHYLVARVLLMSDQSQGEPSHTDGQIAEALDISRRTVIRIKQRFVQGNLEVALAGSFPRERPERRCLDGKGEAQLIHLACSQAPDGRQRWTLELLADQMVKLKYVEHISPETVRQALKKRAKAVAQEVVVFSQRGGWGLCLSHGGRAGGVLSALRSLGPQDLHG
jgi:hypothetical protein